jgi:hypothetical protein
VERHGIYRADNNGSCRNVAQLGLGDRRVMMDACGVVVFDLPHGGVGNSPSESSRFDLHPGKGLTEDGGGDSKADA